MNFVAVKCNNCQSTLYNLLYTVWVEGLPSTLPSSHRSNLARLILLNSLGGRFLRERVFGATSNTRKNHVELAQKASWGPHGVTLGVIFEVQRGSNTTSCGFQVAMPQQTADGHADL